MITVIRIKCTCKLYLVYIHAQISQHTHYVEFYTWLTHFVDLAVRVYQLYSLKMILWGLNHVGVTYSVNKVVTL